MNSDSENESEDQSTGPSIINRIRNLIDSDSEEEQQDKIPNEDDEEEIPKTSANKKKVFTSSSESDSDDGEENEPTQKVDRRKNNNPKKRDLTQKKARKSAVKAMNVIQEEIKRMEGGTTARNDDNDSNKNDEREIRVPYHRPRQFTFQEFMARKYINKPTDDNKGISSKQAMLNAKLHPEAFAMKMKLREEEALEFFRSSSESEDEAEKKVEEPTTAETVRPEVEKVEDHIEKAVEDQEMTESNAPEVSTEVEIPIQTESAPATVADPIIFDDEDDAETVEEVITEKPQMILPDKRPSLSLKPGEVLSFDLETGSTEVRPAKLSAAELFKKNFLDRLAKRTEVKCTDVKSQIVNSINHHRPGEAREILLKSIIEPVHQEKIAALKKSSVAAKLLNKEITELEPEDKEEKLDLESELMDEDEDDEECEEEEEPEENDVIIKDKKTKHSEFMDDEAVDEDDPENAEDEREEDESDEDSSSSSDEEEEVNESKVPRKSRILKAFEDSDDEVDSKQKAPIHPVSESLFSTDEILAQQPNTQQNTLDFLDSQSSFKMPSISENLLSNRIDNLFDPKLTQSQTVEEDDLMDICSGMFAPTQMENTQQQQQTTDEIDDFDEFVTQVSEKVQNTQPDDLDDDFVTQVESQIPVQNNVENLADSQTETPDLLFSNDFESEVNIPSEEIPSTQNNEAEQEIAKIDVRKLLESSDDETEVSEKRKKKLKKRRKKNMKLGFSDDEQDESDHENLEMEEEEDYEEVLDEEEAADVCVDYDSEENEIEVKLTKKEKIKKASNYFENEAEMSESEWGSADEDERGMDKYDIELGDEDDFDQNKLREEVGRIHARKVLDDDIKKVKKLQDAFLEDEENDGIGRERQFKWKNQTNAFDVNDENALDPHDAGSDSEEDGTAEIEWRKRRHERETFLREISQSQTNDKKQSDPSMSELSNSCQSRPSDPQKVLKRIESSSFSSPHFLINTAENMKRYKSSSYLARGADTLKRIAKFVSHKDDEITMSSTGGNSMSFVVLDKPDESKKRKSDGKQEAEMAKRMKLERRMTTNSSLLEQLK